MTGVFRETYLVWRRVFSEKLDLFRGTAWANDNSIAATGHGSKLAFTMGATMNLFPNIYSIFYFGLQKNTSLGVHACLRKLPNSNLPKLSSHMSILNEPRAALLLINPRCKQTNTIRDEPANSKQRKKETYKDLSNSAAMPLWTIYYASIDPK